MHLHCFLDDSGKEGHQSNPYVVLAGYFGEREAWATLQTKWAQLLLKHRISALHMKHLIPLEGEYKRLGWDMEKRDAVVTEFIKEIQGASIGGIGIAVEMAAWRATKSANPKLFFGTAQQWCFSRIVRLLIDDMKAAKIEGEIALVFDRDEEFAAARINLFNSAIRHDPDARRLLVSVMFADPSRYPGIQCADLLAWETRKEMVQRSGGHKSTKRWELLIPRMPPYTLEYVGELWDQPKFDAEMPSVATSYRSPSAP
jgi:hypothetical protein